MSEFKLLDYLEMMQDRLGSIVKDHQPEIDNKSTIKTICKLLVEHYEWDIAYNSSGEPIAVNKMTIDLND